MIVLFQTSGESVSVTMVSNVENLNPQVMRYLGKELGSLCKEPLEGIHVIVNDKDLTEVQAILDGPADTPYAGGRFRVRLHIGKDFPNSPPKVGSHLAESLRKWGAFYSMVLSHCNVGGGGGG